MRPCQGRNVGYALRTEKTGARATNRGLERHRLPYGGPDRDDPLEPRAPSGTLNKKSQGWSAENVCKKGLQPVQLCRLRRQHIRSNDLGGRRRISVSTLRPPEPLQAHERRGRQGRPQELGTWDQGAFQQADLVRPAPLSEHTPCLPAKTVAMVPRQSAVPLHEAQMGQGLVLVVLREEGLEFTAGRRAIRIHCLLHTVK